MGESKKSTSGLRTFDPSPYLRYLRDIVIFATSRPGPENDAAARPRCAATRNAVYNRSSARRAYRGSRLWPPKARALAQTTAADCALLLHGGALVWQSVPLRALDGELLLMSGVESRWSLPSSSMPTTDARRAPLPTSLTSTAGRLARGVALRDPQAICGPVPRTLSMVQPAGDRGLLSSPRGRPRAARYSEKARRGRSSWYQRPHVALSCVIFALSSCYLRVICALSFREKDALCRKQLGI